MPDRIRRLSRAANEAIDDCLYQIYSGSGADKPLGERPSRWLQWALASTERALSRVGGLPAACRWSEAQPPNRNEAAGLLRACRRALAALPAKPPLRTGHPRNHDLKEIPKHYAPRQTYPR